MFICYSDSYNYMRALNISMIESFAVVRVVQDECDTTSYTLKAYAPSYTADCESYILVRTNDYESANHVLSEILLAYSQGRQVCNITECLKNGKENI